MNDQQLARGLGWFGIGLGLAELLAPRKVADAIGVDGHEDLIRTFGLREIASGIGLLSSRDPHPGWMWSRVAGDAVDLASLASALKENADDPRRIRTAIAAVAGVTVLDALCAYRLSQANGHHRNRDRSGRVSAARPGSMAEQWQGGDGPRKVFAITIDRPAEEIYRFWRNLENLPKFMHHLKSVTVSDDRHSHWVAKGPVGTDVEWDAEIIADTPNELIAWRSLPGATVDNAGTVRFESAPGGRGTVVRIALKYDPPAGALGATITKLFGEAPEKQIPVDLRRIKQLLETGEVTRTEGQSSGRSRSTSRKFDDALRT
ncbi:MAG: hypothetical protein RIQ93_66 [Verrucomicrobiota bacterium]|jgi:uncharacterized membrane protein